ncbi:vacuolar alkaline phosphatase [Saxophila tyrrhenica]|uniref:Alkaline phosphatase n=1 Tax=Saxophila tyrrhenica TaxID=1690608 RepID=A0AAV9P3V2_9PEZI|nr:vacuolar alkaline phosphatase [Saxophila tyrrhenica]
MSSPLIAHRPGSQSSNSNAEDHDIAEEDALLTGHRTSKQSPRSSSFFDRSKWREIGLFVWALLATTAVVVLAVVYQHSRASNNGSDGTSPPSGKKNLIFMVSDGMGPTSLSLTRSWRQYTEGLPWDETLILDEHLIGQSRTRSTSSLVTDSAAGATAFSCGMKSYNGAISVLPNFEPCGSVMEAAKRRGYTTGLVVTTRITDATPAVFASHARRREMQDDIARQMVGEKHPLGRMVDLMMGGGRCHFLPNSSMSGCRHDDVDVVKIAKKEGWDYIESKKEFEHLGTSVNMPFLGLFAEHDIPYEIDRREMDDAYPSLEAMTKKALQLLAAETKDKEEGFFVMIEGSRIDHAGHANDPAAQVHEVLAYDRAMAAVLDFIKDEETPTLMVATSDHETGGLATARQLHREYPHYLWHPSVLANVSHSAAFTAHEYHKHLDEHKHAEHDSSSSEDTRAWLAQLSSKALGIHDCSEEEIDTLLEDPVLAAWTFADMVSRRSQTGWSTHGHSGADVNIYSSNPLLAKALVGNHENTDVGAFLRHYLDLDEEVKTVTKNLREHMHSIGAETYLGRIPDDEERLDGQDHLDRYAGDHKKRGGCEVCGL